jgi:hypothetical protein
MPPAASFDHLVGAGEERRRDREAEGFGRLQVDRELELRRLLNRKVGRIAASENAIDVGRAATPEIGTVGGIAQEAASMCSRGPNMLGSRCLIASAASGFIAAM